MGERRLGPVQSGIKMIPAKLNVSGEAWRRRMRLAGRAMDGWSDDPRLDGVVYP